MIVHKLTTEEKDLLIGQQYVTDMYFNPTQDANDNWFISVEEVAQCDKEEFAWVKNLPTIEYNPKIITINDLV